MYTRFTVHKVLHDPLCIDLPRFGSVGSIWANVLSWPCIYFPHNFWIEVRIFEAELAPEQLGTGLCSAVG